jgi:hypothetical protein
VGAGGVITNKPKAQHDHMFAGDGITSTHQGGKLDIGSSKLNSITFYVQFEKTKNCVHYLDSCFSISFFFFLRLGIPWFLRSTLKNFQLSYSNLHHHLGYEANRLMFTGTGFWNWLQLMSVGTEQEEM